MTSVAIRTEAKQLIDMMTDDDIVFVFGYIKSFLKTRNIVEHTENSKMKAFMELEKMLADKPFTSDDFDEKRELEEALKEKYGSFS